MSQKSFEIEGSDGLIFNISLNESDVILRIYTPDAMVVDGKYTLVTQCPSCDDEVELPAFDDTSVTLSVPQFMKVIKQVIDARR